MKNYSLRHQRPKWLQWSRKEILLRSAIRHFKTIISPQISAESEAHASDIFSTIVKAIEQRRSLFTFGGCKQWSVQLPCCKRTVNAHNASDLTRNTSEQGLRVLTANKHRHGTFPAKFQEFASRVDLRRAVVKSFLSAAEFKMAGTSTLKKTELVFRHG